ncbi:MAG: hypothetical protein H6721_27870 [Sandaracinus sp.]|nr:hypothetical protein [Sandaracinus sp.]MCB9615969.1 hypothetical protein [Sandaracinus sp.]MCB9621869.1 hypothetical protein [Sandaracinus sp.]MCB9635945.1 hypothetical protein [Sandaracinus sp.]
MHAWYLGTIVALLGAAAVAAQPVDTPAPPMNEPDVARFGAATCSASAPRELGRSSVRNLRLRVASQPSPRSTTLAVWSHGPHALATRNVGAELGPLREVALDEGMNVEVLAPASEGRFVAISVGALCRGGRARGFSCLRAVGLRADGSPTAAPYEPTPDSQQLEVVASTPLWNGGSPSGVALALVTRWTGAAISLLRLDADGRVTIEEHPIRTEGPSENPIELLASDGEQVVALGVDRSFVLALGHRRHALPPSVPESARLRWARARGEELELFYGLPRGRVRWLRVSGVDGRFVGGTPTTMGPTDALPATPVFPALEVHRGSLVLTRTDLRGAAVGEPFTLAPASGRMVTSWSWDGSALHAVWGTRVGDEWVISESRVTCAP